MEVLVLSWAEAAGTVWEGVVWIGLMKMICTSTRWTRLMEQGA